jgi:hypothetical protein
MPRSGSDVPDRQKTPEMLRQQAERARRWASAITSAVDQRVLSELADTLEAEAAELERGGG